MDALYIAGLASAFAFLGAGIKYIDSVFDEGVFDKRIALILTAICGILMGVLIASDPYAAAVLIAIVLGVALTQKIDNFAFLIGASLAIGIPVLVANVTTFYFLPIAVLVFGGILDEIGNNMVDAGRIRNRAGQVFFHYRLTTEVLMGMLVILGQVPAPYWLALILFDLSYHIVGGHAEKVKLSQFSITRGETSAEIWTRLQQAPLASPEGRRD